MAAPNSTATNVDNIEAITAGLTKTVLGDDIVNTALAVETPTEPDDIDAIASGLDRTVLGEDDKQSSADLPVDKGKGKAVERYDREAKLDPAGIASEQPAEEEEEGIDALRTACGSLSLQYDDAEAQREAQQLREQIKQEHEDKMRALANAEAKRKTDEQLSAFTRQFQADIDAAQVKKMRRKARKEADKEAARQLREAAEAEEIIRAERRAEQERRSQAEAQAAQAKRESDEKARLELSQIYDNIFSSAAIAQANFQEAQRQQQIHEAELIAQYHEAVARQAELERRQQEELFLQHQLMEQQRLIEQQRMAEQQYLAEHYNAYPLGEQVSQDAEEMDVAPEGDDVEGAEMDTAPEMEAAVETEMDWEQVEEQTPLLAEPLLQLPQSTAQSAPESNAPAEELPSVVDSFESEAPAMPAADKMEASSHASTVADNIAGPPSAAGPISADNDQQPATLAAGRPIEADATTEATPAPAEAITSAEAALPAPSAIAATSPPANVLPLPPRPTTPPPPPAPMPAPITSSPKAIKIVLKGAVPNPALAALRPTISSWSPLGRLLSQKKPIPQVALSQVLGKRARGDWEDSGRDKKKAKLEGEFKFEVGGKRKREDETFPGKKRVLCNRRALAVPCSRLAAGPSITSTNCAAPSPPTPTPPNALPAPVPSSPSPLPPPPAVGPEANPHRGLAEAIELYNDLPTLRAEISWMRAQRLNTSREETRGEKSPRNTKTPASYWSRYRENLSR